MMLKLCLRVTFLALLAFASTSGLRDPLLRSCVINLDKWDKTYEPILASNGDFIYPQTEDLDENRLLILENGEDLNLLCHGSPYNPSYLKSSSPPKSQMDLFCHNGVLRDASTQRVVNIYEVECDSRHEPEIRQENELCATEGLNGRDLKLEYQQLIRVGWMIDGQFREQYRVCMDTNTDASLWTQHTVQGFSIGLRDIDSGRPAFRRDIRDYPDPSRFFTQFNTDGKLSDSYTKSSQLTFVESILNTNTIDGNLILDTSTSGTSYFARGHLSPDAAFVYNVQQDATYYFFNVAAQYQSFNNGNWKALEGAVRALAVNSGSNMKVYTGTYGNLKMPDIDGTQRTLYIAEEAGEKLLYVPKYYWKVVHDPDTNQAVAFVGVNDPHITSKPSLMCRDVCDSLSWVGWSREDLGSGYMYCCLVQDLKTDIEYVPDLSNDGVWPSLLQHVNAI